jgi:hypothetical protein
LASPESTELNEDADADKSDANPSQADAAVNNDPDPAPAKIRAELISGGNQEKLRTIAPSQIRPHQRLRQPRTSTSTHRNDMRVATAGS